MIRKSLKKLTVIANAVCPTISQYYEDTVQCKPSYWYKDLLHRINCQDGVQSTTVKKETQLGAQLSPCSDRLNGFIA